eukprot:3513362-Rhodomonas_salina.8
MSSPGPATEPCAVPHAHSPSRGEQAWYHPHRQDQGQDQDQDENEHEHQRSTAVVTPGTISVTISASTSMPLVRPQCWRNTHRRNRGTWT